MSNPFDKMPQPANDEHYNDNGEDFINHAKQAGLSVEEYKQLYQNIKALQADERRYHFPGDEEVSTVIHNAIMKEIELSQSKNDALTDPLTKLPNRRAFDDEFERKTTLLENKRRLSDQEKRPSLYVVFLDIDNFKKINDTYGHDAGDIVLQRLASLLKTTVRENDFVARTGGEEFVFLIENQGLGISDIHTIVERIRKTIESTPIPLSKDTIHITTSIGIAEYIKNDSCIKKADDAMYRSKMEGKNRISFYDPKSDSIVPLHSNEHADISVAS